MYNIYNFSFFFLCGVKVSLCEAYMRPKSAGGEGVVAYISRRPTESCSVPLPPSSPQHV